MTYTEHFWRSAWFAVCFLALAAQAAVHAVVPGVFQTTTTDAVVGWLPVLLETTDRRPEAAAKPDGVTPAEAPAGPSA